MRSVLQVSLLGVAIYTILPESSHASTSIGEAFGDLFKRCGTCESSQVCLDQKKLEWCQEKCQAKVQRNVCSLFSNAPLKETQKHEERHEERKENMVERLHSSLAGTGDHLFGILSKHP